MTLPVKLYQTQFQDSGLKLRSRFIAYSDIAEISHCNIMHMSTALLIPECEIFCVSLISNGKRTVLYKKVNLGHYVSGKSLKEVFKTGLQLPQDIEQQMRNLRYEHLETIELLRQLSGVEPRERGLSFANVMGIYAFFANAA